MLPTLLLITTFLVLGTFTIGLQNNNANNNLKCENDYTCIPFSECEEVKDMVDGNVTTFNYTSVFCGYFHEPFVCCDKNCVTPNGNYGKVLSLNDCDHLEGNLQSIDRKRRKFFLESQVNDTHVCCNKNESTYNSVPPAPVASKNRTLVPSRSTCVTLNGEKAKCVHIQDCEPYKGLINGTNEEFRYVNESFCGWWKQPMVCCGDATNYKESFADKLPNSSYECGKWDGLNGQSTPPWLAFIEENKTKSVCVGVIINQNYVLSTINCTGTDHKDLSIIVGNCINNQTNKDCTYKVDELKIFPHHKYIHNEDTGLVLVKLSRLINFDYASPVCLHMEELALYEEVHILYIEQLDKQWVTTTFLTKTIENTSCHAELGSYYEKILCIRMEQFCEDRKKKFLRSVIVYPEDDGRWYLDGLFNKNDNCYGTTSDYLNAIYIHKFIPWIKSNIS